MKLQKYLASILFIIISISSSQANVIFDLYNSSELYGILDNQAGPTNYTTRGITATFQTPSGHMNRTDSGFGINAASSTDNTYTIDDDDILYISFNTDITITNINFRNFTTDELIQVDIGTLAGNTFTPATSNTINYDDLGDKTTASTELLNWNLSRNQTLCFCIPANNASTIALDSITIIPEPATISLLFFSGVTLIWKRKQMC